jgi:hemoglobin/transferrin/lactoferrin receptor protein
MRETPVGPLVARRVIAALLAAALPGHAAADEPGDLGTVWVFARVLQPLAQVAANVTVFDQATVEHQLARDFRDAVLYTPGVSVPNDPTRFGLGTITIRGIGDNRVLIETDGVPAPSGFAIGNFSNASRPFADLDLVKRTEIMRGPASALYGSDAIGGVVSTRTLAPADLLGATDGALCVRSGYYSADHSWLVSAAAAGRSAAGVEALIAYARREGSELQNGPAVLEPNPRDYARDTVLAKLVLAGMDHPLGLTIGETRDAAVTLVNSDVLQPGRFANTTFMQGDDHAESQRLIIDQSFLLNGGEQAEWRVYWQESRTDELTFETRRPAPPRTPALEISRDFFFRDVTLGAQATVAHELHLGQLSHRLVFGGEIERHRLDEQRDGRQTSLPTGTVTNVILGEVFPLRDFPITTQTQAGAYLQDELRTHADRVAWMPAVRLDYYRLRPAADTAYVNGNPGQVPVSVSQTAASPRFGGTWRVTDAKTLFWQYTHGFRSPPFADVNIGLYLPQFNVRAIPNPDLKPEKSDGLEFGLRSAAAVVTGSVSTFYTRYRDFIESKVNLGVDPVTGTTLFQSRNLARAEIWGIEAEGRIRPGASTMRATPLSVRYALSFAHGDDLERNRPLNSVDPARAVVGIAYDAANGGSGAELHVTAVARKERIDDSPTALVRTPGFMTVDLLAHWRFAEGAVLEAGVFNLANRSYLEWADVSNRAANDPTLDLYRRPGRNASIFVSYRW